MNYYPVYLKLKGKRCVVIGGNDEAECKVVGMLAADGEIVVISPEPSPGIKKLAEQGRIDLHERPYQPGDLAGAWIVFAVTTDATEIAQIWAEGAQVNALVNVMDNVPHCNFIAPSLIKRGDLTVAISTNGKAPAIAVRLRQMLDEIIGPEYGEFLALAGTLRAPLAAKYPSFEERRRMWYELVDSGVLELLREGQHEAVHQRVRDIMQIEPANQEAG